MAEEVDRRDGDECPKEPGGYRSGLDAVCVEAEGHEADADVEGFARDLVFVDKVAVVTV